uniref:F-box protein At5g07610-like n=1 Tax=Erigeron canadensis TaxID=72917 RepID=UPI001CB98787
NGLLLCCSDRGKEYKRKYYVFNPITKQFAVIPSIIGGPNASRTIRFMCLAFHPLDFVHYKIVCFRKAKPRQNLVQIQIYSSDTGKWKILNQSFSSPCYLLSVGSGVYWNGAIHWAHTSLDPLYFKLDVEQLQRLLLPERAASSRGYDYIAMPLYFGESQGHLHLVERATHKSNLHLKVYEALSDHSGWFLKYQVDLDELPLIYPLLVNQNQLNYEFKVLDVVRGEEEEDAFMVVKIPQKIIRYDILKKTFKEIFDLPNVLHHRRIGHEYVHRFTESLSSF